MSVVRTLDIDYEKLKPLSLVIYLERLPSIRRVHKQLKILRLLVNILDQVTPS